MCGLRLSYTQVSYQCCLHIQHAQIPQPWGQGRERSLKDNAYVLEDSPQWPSCQSCPLVFLKPTQTPKAKGESRGHAGRLNVWQWPFVELGVGGGSQPEPCEHMNYWCSHEIQDGRCVTLQLCVTWQAPARQELWGLLGFPPPFRSPVVTLIPF